MNRLLSDYGARWNDRKIEGLEKPPEPKVTVYEGDLSRRELREDTLEGPLGGHGGDAAVDDAGHDTSVVGDRVFEAIGQQPHAGRIEEARREIEPRTSPRHRAMSTSALSGQCRGSPSVWPERSSGEACQGTGGEGLPGWGDAGEGHLVGVANGGPAAPG